MLLLLNNYGGWGGVEKEKSNLSRKHSAPDEQEGAGNRVRGAW